MSTADIGNLRARFKFVMHTIERRNPTTYEISGIARTEKTFHPMEQRRIMLVPAEPVSGAKCR